MKYNSRKILFFFISVALLIMAIVYSSFRTGRDIAVRYFPLVTAAMEIEIEATTAHLWFEKVMSGDRTVDIETIWNHLEKSEWYAQAMLDGVKNEKGTLLALVAPQLQLQIKKTIVDLQKFRHIAQQRWDAQSTSGIGSEIDQQFGQNFIEFNIAIDDVQNSLEKFIIKDIQKSKRMQQLLMIFVIISGAITGGLLLRYNARINKQILELHKQEESLRIALKSIGDAVIVTDTEGAVTYINKIAIQLTGWTSDQALGQPLTRVLNTVHAHTLEPVNNPVKMVLETGSIAGLSHHTMLIAKDDTKYQISISGAPARNPAGNINGVVFVFRDVTEEYALNEQLSSSQALIKTLLDTVPDLIWLKDKKGVYLACNAKFARMYNSPENEIIGKTDYDFIDKERADYFHKNDQHVLISGKTTAYEELLPFADDNHSEFVEAIKTPMLDNNGNLIGILGVARDITKYKESLTQLKESESRLNAAQSYAKIGYWELQEDQKTAFWSDQMYALFGTDKGSKTGPETLCKVMNRSDFQTFTTSIKKSFSTGYEHHIFYQITRPNDGQKRWIECRGKLEMNSVDKTFKVSGFAQDITEQKNEQEKLKLSSRVFSDTHEGIVITNSEQLIVDVNPAFSQITGYSLEDSVGKPLSILKSGKQSPQFYADMWQTVTEQGYWQGEVWNRTRQGSLYAESLNISSLKNDQDKVTHYVGMFSDITKSKQQQDQLNLIAHYDVLTKLPNRVLFINRFHQSIIHSMRTGHQFAVCFLDLDDFKPVNDNYGHETGDRLLIEVAKRITACIRKEDTVSRQGGDEFAILLNDIESDSQYEKTINRIHQALALPYFLDDVQHNVTASSGVTLYPSDDGDIDTLLRHADRAMYQSKLLGKNRFQLYNPDSDQRIIRNNHQRGEIEQALDQHEFQLYYQPKVNMITGDVFGVEALIRWIHPEKGIIPPLKFLPFIEGTPLEIKVGQWVINEALRQLDVWQQQGVKLEVSVNISSNHLLSSSFVIDLEKSLEKYPSANAKYLQLEILESSALGDINTINHTIENCQKRLGVSFSLDDFGTGYSSLTHLRNLPVSTIKIDKSFVQDMLDDPSDYSIIDGVIALTKSFNRNVIAEGVETTEHGLMLLLMGCEEAQGYQIAKPMPAAALSQWLSTYIPNQEWRLCGNKHLNDKENSLAIFRIITAQWKVKITRKVVSSPDNVIP
ncbi:EAL domain-containing protein [Desulforhopalus vacuolatus]|uniref:sensor domain-containing protein n=1 Tax=Desulforhopalus vacuolatus TaxID=40414 RepID=UPI0019633C23|nr:EAL domain-containing protein [Desulforhopalus vacuolatus]MBM9519996.1 EAL domain-containing protein [Desulforhopalus vacuolatus]